MMDASFSTIPHILSSSTEMECEVHSMCTGRPSASDSCDDDNDSCTLSLSIISCSLSNICVMSKCVFMDRGKGMMKYMLKCDKRTRLQQHCHCYSIIAFKTIQRKYWMSTLAIDQGTSSTRAVLFDENLRATRIVQKCIKMYAPREGWAEQDANEILDSVRKCMDEMGREGVKWIGLTNQRESTVAWSKSSGDALCPVISWMDRRTDEIVKRGEFQSDYLRESTGLRNSTYFSLSKMIWMLENVEGVKKAAERDDLCFGTIDAWLLTKLTGLFVTDATNASRTMLMNVERKEWDDKILESFKISKEWLPEIRADNYGMIKGIPVKAVMGDQHASFYAHSAPIKCTYGTGTFLFVDGGGSGRCAQDDFIWTVAHDDGYAMEAPMNVGSCLLNWLASLLGVDEKELLRMAEKGREGVMFVPFNPTAPLWKSGQGSFHGLTLETRQEDLARAVLKSIAIFVALSLERVETLWRESGRVIDKLVVDGGLARSDVLMQMQADVLDKAVQRPRFLEYTALGIAMKCERGRRCEVETEYDVFIPNPNSSMKGDLERMKGLLGEEGEG